MSDTKQYIDFIKGKKGRREKIENVDFSKMPAGVDAMAVAEELGLGLPDDYRAEILSRAKSRGVIKGLDYSAIDMSVPAVHSKPGTVPIPAPMPLNIDPPRQGVPPVGVAPTLPSPTKAEMPQRIDQRAKDVARGTAGVVSSGIEGFGNIAGFLGAAGMKADSETTADFINAFSERHLANPEADVFSEILSGLGSTGPFLVGGRLVAGGVRLAGALTKTRKGIEFANKLGTLLGMSSIATTNAMVEGGAVAQELRIEGASKEKQKDAFWKAFNANGLLSLALNRWMLGGTGGRAKAAIHGAKSEFTEETLQSVISKLAQGKEVDMGQALYEGGIGAIVGGGLGAIGAKSQPPAAEAQPLPTLPISPNLDEATKTRAMQMAQTDPIAAMKLVTPASEWANIDRMSTELAEGAEGAQEVPAAEKRAAVQAALSGILQNSLAPAATAEQVEGVAPAAPEVDPQITFMRTQMAVLKKVAEKAKLQGDQIAGLMAGKVHGGDVRTLVERGLAENKTPDQIAEEFLSQFEGVQVEGVAPEAPAGPEVATEAATEAAPEVPAGRWSDIAQAEQATPGMAVAAIDMTEEGAGAVIIKTGDGRFTVRSEFAEVASPTDEDGLYFNTLEEAKAAVEAALPAEGALPAQLPLEAALPAIQAVPSATEERLDIPEATLEYEAQREQSRIEGEPVYEGDTVSEEDFDTAVLPESVNPASVTYTEAKKRFTNLTPAQHQALIRGQLAAGQVVPDEVMAEYPGMAAELQAEAESEMARAEAPVGSPLLGLISSRGFINRANYEKHWAGELPRDDMKFYIRKKGKATVSQLAEAAFEAGLIPEAGESAFIEAIGTELRSRAAVAREEGAGFLAEPTSSPKFKAWFGDSKVVDEQGKPLVVYRGARGLTSLAADNYPGVKFFSDSMDTAQRFADEAKYILTIDGKQEPITEDKFRIISENIEPTETLSWHEGWDLLAETDAKVADKVRAEVGVKDAKSISITLNKNLVESVYLNLKNPFIYDAQGKTWGEEGIAPELFIKRAKKGGHDGIIVKNIVEGGLADPDLKPTTTYLTFSPNQIKSVENIGAFDPTDPNIMREPGAGFLKQPEPFYSKLQRTIEQKRTGPMPAAQLQGMSKAAGIKQDELDWFDLDSFLKDNPKPTKEQVLDYLAANQLEIKEVMKTPSTMFSAAGRAAEARHVVKFEKYQLPGGENYREVLFTLPVESDNIEIVKTKRPSVDSGFFSEPSKERDGFTIHVNGKEVSELFDTEAEAKNNISKYKVWGGGFKSSHWSEPNVLAHVRLNDRTVDGKKVLFIEEVQSDWHQAGREKGYKGPAPEGEAYQDPTDKNRWRLKSIPDKTVWFSNKIEAERYWTDTKAVPSAPLKKTWHEFVMKRAIRMASEQGYDAIAWTTGAQQAERYDLSKEIKHLDYKKNDDGTFNITAQKDGRGHSIGENVPAVKLSDYVGKDVADKIISGAGKQVGYHGNNEPEIFYNRLTGIDLKIGGEGMAGFYDTMLPSFVNKFTKKWGGRVEDIKIKQDEYNFDFPRQANGLYNVVSKETGAVVESNISLDKLQEYQTKSHTFHSLAITPDLRRAAMTEGFPLFEPGHVYTQNELFPTEREAFTIPPAEAVEKVIDDIKNVKPVGQFHDMRLEKAAEKIDADLKKYGLTKFIGMKVENIQDAAEIVATVRHPLIEHLWIIYVKGGKIVGSSHHTTGNLARINISSVALSEQIKKDMTAMGSDGFYISHNHPSGNPTPSGEQYDMGQARYLAGRHGDAFKGSLVTDHKYYSVIGADGKATFHEFKTEQPAFRKRDLKKVGEGDKARIEQAEGPDVIMSPGAAAKFSKDILQGKALGLMFLDNKNALMSFDHIDPKSDIDAYVSKHAKNYGSNQVVLVTGEEGMAKMKWSGVLKGIYQDLVVLSNDGSYKSARLGQIKGWSREEWKLEEIGQFADSETAGMIAEPGSMYRPGDYRKVIAKVKPGAKLTARGRIADLTGDIPRGATVTLTDIDQSTGQAIVEYEGRVLLARLDMFKETYQKPGEPVVIPGIPVKRAIERVSGVKPVERAVVTTQMKALNAKLATEAKAANTAGKAVKAELMEDLRLSRKSAEAIRKAAVEYIGQTVPKAIQFKFIGMVNGAKDTTTLAKVVVRADAEADKVYRRGLTEDIKKVSSRALESLKVDVEYKEAVRSLLAEFDLVKRRPETMLKLKALQDYVIRAEASGKDIFLPDEMTKRLRILATRPIDEISNGELEIALRDLYILEAVGKEGQAQKEAAWEIEKNMWLRDFVTDAKPIGGLAQELSESSKQWAWAQENYWALGPMNVLCDRLDGGTGKHNGAHSRMKQIIDGDFFRFQDMCRAHIDPYMTLLDKHGLGEENLDRIGIYAFKVQKDGVARVLASMPELTEEYVQNLTLTPQETEVYNLMRGSFESLHPEVKRLMGKLYNREVGTLDKYFAMRMDWDKLTEMEVLERQAISPEEFTGMRKNITAGFTKTRKAGAKAPIIMNAGKVFTQVITDMTYFIAMQENVKKFSEITNPKTNPEYMEAVGPIGTKIIRSWLDLLARQGKAEGSKRLGWLDWARVNVGSGVLGFKLSSFLIQSTAFLDGCAAVGGINMTSALAKFTSDRDTRVWLINNFSKYRERVGDDPSFGALSQSEWLKKWQRRGYIPLKWLDGIMAGTTTLAAYNKAAKELGVAPGGSGPLNAEAAKAANFWLDRTQASPFFLDLGVAFNSPLFLLRNVSANKALLQFKSFVVNRWFFMSYDIPRMESTADKASAYAYLLAAGAAEMGIRGASRGIILTAMASVGWGIASSVKDAEWDDDMWLEYFKTLVGMCPFIDSPISSLKYGSNPIPVIDVGDKMLMGASDWLNSQNGYRRVVGLRKALTGLALLAGVPGTSMAGQIWAWSYNPKTLTFPYNEEYKELADLGYRRTAGESDRMRKLDSSKARFTAYARAYRDAMARGNMEAATKAVSGATAALEAL